MLPKALPKGPGHRGIESVEGPLSPTLGDEGNFETMLQHYEDILSRIAEPPRWFDEQGVPRYCDFAPDRIANIHARECALLAIECQSCGRPFIVALDGSTANRNVISPPGQKPPWRALAEIIRSHQIEY